jgi:serine/threonine protein kinase/predicted Zn-dependent protease
MPPDRWQRLKSILAEALEKASAEARRAALKHLCADDADLLSEAESLLLEAEVLVRDRFDALEECANKAGSAIPRDDGPVIGKRIGSYVVTRELGRGGMGTVYLAARADGYFEKQVAVKVLSRGRDSEELLHRFRAEREVLARLDHPNIARLIDAGTTDDGLPYFIMDYVEGVPITRFVEINHEPVARRLTLFLRVCAAVEAAHHGSVVHRDLKSTNILVDREGEPKLLDFGIAKVVGSETNPLEITAFGQERLTPVSASPEQVRGEPITILSDIYALGAVLYEMLTGERPHRFPTDTPSPEQLRDVVCKQPPIPPSLVVKDRSKRLQLRGDLDAIVLMALQKDPAKRYESVFQFAEDIRGHLAGRSVRARENKKSYRLKNLLRNNRPVQVSAAAVGLALFVTAAFFVGSWLHLGLKRPDLQNSTSFSSRVEPQLPTEKTIAVLPFDTLDNDKENAYFADGVQEAILTDLANVDELKVISRGSVASYRGKPKNEREIGQTLGVSYVLEGSVQKAGERIRVNAHLIDTRTMAEVWAQQYDRKLDDLFAVQSDLAQTIVSQLKGKLSPAEKAAIENRPTADMLAYDLYLRARESFFQNNCENAVHLLEQAIARDPQFVFARFLLAQVQFFSYRYNDNTPERLNQAKEAAEAALRLAPDLPQSHLTKAQYCYYGLRDYEQALRELSTVTPSGADAAQFLDLAALSERRLGHWRNALRDGEKAVELDPQNPFLIGGLLNSYIAVRRFSDAVELANKAIKAMISQDGYIWSLKSQALLRMGRVKEATAVVEDSPPGVSRLYQIATIELFMRDFIRASQLLENATPAEKGSYATALLDGMVARAQGDTTRAQSSFQLARDRITLKLREGADDPELLSSLAVADAALGRKEEALDEAKRATEICPISHDAVDGPTYRLVLAQVYTWNGQPDEAFAELAKIVRLPQGPSYGELRFNPAWDEIRDDPRFETLLNEATRPPAFD